MEPAITEQAITITEQAVAMVTFKELKAGLSQFNKAGVVRKGRGLTGVTRPVAFAKVLAANAGKTVRRLQLNKAMWVGYRSSDVNSAWWVGVYMQLLCALGLCTEKSRGTFTISPDFKEL